MVSRGKAFYERKFEKNRHKPFSRALGAPFRLIVIFWGTFPPKCRGLYLKSQAIIMQKTGQELIFLREYGESSQYL
jgi:hypothetical protein